LGWVACTRLERAGGDCSAGTPTEHLAASAQRLAAPSGMKLPAVCRMALRTAEERSGMRGRF
jgi:hypothetical protein